MVRVSVHVKLYKQQPHVEKNHDGSFTVFLSSPPERGKANAQLQKLLSIHFNIPPSRVRIVSGSTSRRKIVELS